MNALTNYLNFFLNTPLISSVTNDAFYIPSILEGLPRTPYHIMDSIPNLAVCTMDCCLEYIQRR